MTFTCWLAGKSALEITPIGRGLLRMSRNPACHRCPPHLHSRCRIVLRLASQAPRHPRDGRTHRRNLLPCYGTTMRGPTHRPRPAWLVRVMVSERATPAQRNEDRHENARSAGRTPWSRTATGTYGSTTGAHTGDRTLTGSLTDTDTATNASNPTALSPPE